MTTAIIITTAIVAAYIPGLVLSYRKGRYLKIRKYLLGRLFNSNGDLRKFCYIEKADLLIDLSYEEGDSTGAALTAELVKKNGSGISFLRSLAGKNGPDIEKTICRKVPAFERERIAKAARNGIAAKKEFAVIELFPGFFELGTSYGSRGVWEFAVPMAGIDGQYAELNKRLDRLCLMVMLIVVEQKLKELTGHKMAQKPEFYELHESDLIPFFTKGEAGDACRKQAGISRAFESTARLLSKGTVWLTDQMPGIPQNAPE